MTYMCREKGGVSVCRLPEDNAFFSVKGHVSHCLWSPNGEGLVLCNDTKGILEVFYDSDLSKQTLLQTSTKTSAIDPNLLRRILWSPRGSFVATLWIYHSTQQSQTDPNVLVWDMNVGIQQSAKELLPTASFRILKGGSSDAFFSWRKDERICCTTTAQGISVYKSQPLTNESLVQTIPVLGLTHLAVSPNCDESTQCAAFCQNKKGKVSVCRVFRNIENTTIEDIAIAEYTVPLSDSAEILWSPSGDAVLFITTSAIDSTGENYGEVKNVYLYNCSKSSWNQVNTLITQEASWCPKKDIFVIIQGKCPSGISLYNSSCEVVHTFPSNYRNVVYWDVLGQMLVIGGFGNLAGDISFWYIDEENQTTQIAEWRAPCTGFCQWDSSCQYFLTASVAPRMRVDNHMIVYNRSGEMIFNRRFEELFDVQWKPGEAPSRPLPCPKQNLPAETAEPKLFRPRFAAADSKHAPLSIPSFPRPTAKKNSKTQGKEKGETKKEQSKFDHDWRQPVTVNDNGVSSRTTASQQNNRFFGGQQNNKTYSGSNNKKVDRTDDRVNRLQPNSDKQEEMIKDLVSELLSSETTTSLPQSTSSKPPNDTANQSNDDGSSFRTQIYNWNNNSEIPQKTNSNTETAEADTGLLSILKQVLPSDARIQILKSSGKPIQTVAGLVENDHNNLPAMDLKYLGNHHRERQKKCEQKINDFSKTNPSSVANYVGQSGLSSSVSLNEQPMNIHTNKEVAEFNFKKNLTSSNEACWEYSMINQRIVHGRYTSSQMRKLYVSGLLKLNQVVFRCRETDLFYPLHRLYPHGAEPFVDEPQQVTPTALSKNDAIKVHRF